MMTISVPDVLKQHVLFKKKNLKMTLVGNGGCYSLSDKSKLRKNYQYK